MNEQDNNSKWTNLGAALGTIAAGTNWKKVTAQTGLGLSVALVPFILPFLSSKQQGATIIAVSGLTSALAAIQNTRK